MKPVFFPFTCISKPVLENFMTCFKKVAIYIPSSRSVDPEMIELSKINILDLRIPVKTDEDKLDSLYLDYLKWAELHEKTGITSFKTQKNIPPLFDSTWTAQIKSDIRNYEKHKAVIEPDPEFIARLFLKIAQKHDRHYHEIYQDIKSIHRMEQKLFKELKGEKSNSFSDSYKNTLHDSADIGAYMTKERMASWCRIMQHDADPPSGIFITNSIAVWNHIMDSSPEAQVVGNSIPVKAAFKSKKLHENLSEFLDKLQREKWSSADLKPDEFSQNINFNNLISLEIVIIPGQTPTDYFSRFISHPQGEIKQNPYRSAFQNTVLCLLE